MQFTFSPPFYFRPRQIFFIDTLQGWVIGDNGIVLHTSTGGVVPVELISFTAEIIEGGVMLNWTTATETNNQGFEVQRLEVKSHPALTEEWEAIGFVKGSGTTTEPKSYSFTDNNVFTGNYKYRLRQIDYDGTFTHSNVIEVAFDFTPKEFMLYQNYPNPFNPTTQIKYSVAESDLVALKVFDVLGREIATFVNEQQQPGSYEIKFDATNLSSGIYFYQLKAGGFIDTKKMTLIK